MAYPTLYLQFPGTARAALTYYQSIFGGEVQIFSYEQFGRTDGPADAVAHGELTGPVTLQAADDGSANPSISAALLTILGEDEALQRQWFAGLAEEGRITDDLQKRPWGDFDGQVTDKFGLPWLIGFKGNS